MRDRTRLMLNDERMCPPCVLRVSLLDGQRAFKAGRTQITYRGAGVGARTETYARPLAAHSGETGDEAPLRYSTKLHAGEGLAPNGFRREVWSVTSFRTSDSLNGTSVVVVVVVDGDGDGDEGNSIEHRPNLEPC